MGWYFLVFILSQCRWKSFIKKRSVLVSRLSLFCNEMISEEPIHASLVSGEEMYQLACMNLWFRIVIGGASQTSYITM